MTALDHLNGTQLKMFMSAREITGSFSPRDHEEIEPGEVETDEDLYARKLDESHSMYSGDSHASLVESVLNEGVRTPVHLAHRGLFGGPMVGEGHHRIAIMDFHEPDELMPVIHHDRVTDVYAKPLQRYYRTH